MRFCHISWDYSPEQEDTSKLCGSFHHLFIGMRYGSNIVFIEPWTYDPELFLMEDNWPARKYNPSCNIYGETAKWMGKFYK